MCLLKVDMNAFFICCSMFITEYAVINFSVLVMLVLGFYIASAKQSNNVYCGGNVCCNFIFIFV